MSIDKTREAPDLHAQIMNIADGVLGNDEFCRGFKHGHKAARHQAAELAAANAQEVKRLRQALEMVSAHYSASLDHQPSFVRVVRAALQGDK